MAKIYTDEERKAICESWRQSGLSKNAYCKQPGNISEYSLRQWTKNDINSEMALAPIKFLQINHQPQTKPINPPVNSPIEATLPNGIILKFNLSLVSNGILEELLKWK